MIKKYKIMTYRMLNYLKDVEKAQRARLDSLKKYDGLMLKEKKRPSGKAYYSSYRKNSTKENRRFKYIGGQNSEAVLRIKELHHLKKLLSVISKDIGLLNSVLNNLEEIDVEHINESLPATYRASEFRQELSPNKIAAEWKRSREAYKNSFPPYRPEELTVPTCDNTMVRSKSEALIYNFLFSLGITFIYELPLKTEVRLFRPDFTILSEIDYSSVYRIEHQGKMDDDIYGERFDTRVKDYLHAGYVQGINIFYTFDNYRGGVDMHPILDIIRLKIRPDVTAAPDP